MKENILEKQVQIKYVHILAMITNISKKPYFNNNIIFAWN